MDWSALRREFPVTSRVFTSPVTGERHGLVYLDHAASTQPHQSVLDAVMDFMSTGYANVHRAHHYLSDEASARYEGALARLRAFLGDPHARGGEIIFSGNTTGALNLASHLVRDEPGLVLVTALEHHSNDLPHRAANNVLRARCLRDGSLDLADVERKLRSAPVKLLAVTGASNVTGVTPPIYDLARLAHEHGARILVDCAQRFAHAPIDVKAPGHPEHLDFVAAAGHKAYAPFGSSILYAPHDLIEKAAPREPGGGTVSYVGPDEVGWTRGVHRHESGTPNAAGAVAFATAAELLSRIGMEEVQRHEQQLLARMMAGLTSIPGVRILGPERPQDRIGVVSFLIEGVDHGLAAMVLNHEYGVATRSGCFCAHPYLVQLLDVKDTAAVRERLLAGGKGSEGIPGAVRASLGLYNNEGDVDRFLEGVRATASGKLRGKYHRDPSRGWTAEACGHF